MIKNKTKQQPCNLKQHYEYISRRDLACFVNSVEGNGKVPLAQETLLLVVLYHLEHLEVLEVPKRVELYDINEDILKEKVITHRGAKFSNTSRARRTRSPLETNITLHVQVCKFNKGKIKK